MPKARIFIVLFALAAMMILVGLSFAYANQKERISRDEALETVIDYILGDISGNEAREILTDYRNQQADLRSTPSPTPTQAATLPPVLAEPIPPLDCGAREIAPSSPSTEEVSRHLEAEVTVGDVLVWNLAFSIVEDSTPIVSGGSRGTSTTYKDVEGFTLTVNSDGEWQYRRLASDWTRPGFGARHALLQSGYLDDNDIPLNTQEGETNRVTFLSRTTDYDGYRFYLNGYLIPIKFTGIDDILEREHLRYHPDRRYRFRKSWWAGDIIRSCAVNSWNARWLDE